MNFIYVQNHRYSGEEKDGEKYLAHLERVVDPLDGKWSKLRKTFYITPQGDKSNSSKQMIQMQTLTLLKII